MDVSLGLYLSQVPTIRTLVLSQFWHWGCLLPGKISLTHLMAYYSPRWDLTQAAGQQGCSGHNTREKSGAGEGREGGELPPPSSHHILILECIIPRQDRRAGQWCWRMMENQKYSLDHRAAPSCIPHSVWLAERPGVLSGDGDCPGQISGSHVWRCLLSRSDILTD